jgi:hypothetical protein
MLVEKSGHAALRPRLQAVPQVEKTHVAAAGRHF